MARASERWSSARTLVMAEATLSNDEADGGVKKGLPPKKRLRLSLSCGDKKRKDAIVRDENRWVVLNESEAPLTSATHIALPCVAKNCSSPLKKRLQLSLPCSKKKRTNASATDETDEASSTNSRRRVWLQNVSQRTQQ